MSRWVLSVVDDGWMAELIATAITQGMIRVALREPDELPTVAELEADGARRLTVVEPPR